MEQKELIDLIAENAENATVEIPMELAVKIAYELDRLNKIREALK